MKTKMTPLSKFYVALIMISGVYPMTASFMSPVFQEVSENTVGISN